MIFRRFGEHEHSLACRGKGMFKTVCEEFGNDDDQKMLFDDSTNAELVREHEIEYVFALDGILYEGVRTSVGGLLVDAVM